MRSSSTEKLKITSAVQDKASKTVFPIPENSDVSAAMWDGVSPGECIPLDGAGLFQLGQFCPVGNIVILQQFSCRERKNNCCYIFLCLVFLE